MFAVKECIDDAVIGNLVGIAADIAEVDDRVEVLEAVECRCGIQILCKVLGIGKNTCGEILVNFACAFVVVEVTGDGNGRIQQTNLPSYDITVEVAKYTIVCIEGYSDDIYPVDTGGEYSPVGTTWNVRKLTFTFGTNGYIRIATA